MNLQITYQINPGFSRAINAVRALELGYHVVASTDTTMTFQGLADEQQVEDFQTLIDQLEVEYITNYLLVE